MKKQILAGLAIGAFTFGLTTSANADLLTGAITDLPESGAYGTGSYEWGDGVHNLFQEWSTWSSYSEASGLKNYGWFYASNYSGSNADVYVYSGLTDPSTVTDASGFSYTTSGAIRGGEGDTVFFRGTNGYYGAWRIDDIYANSVPDVIPHTFLTGQWYFQNNGTANFSTTPIPEPDAYAMLLVGLGLLGFASRRMQQVA